MTHFTPDPFYPSSPYVDNSIGVNFTKILNGSLEESKFLYVLGFFAGSW